MATDITVDGGGGIDRIKFTSAINTLTSPWPDWNNFHANFTRVSSVEQVELFGASSVNLGNVFPTVGVTTIITGNDNTTLRYDNTLLGNITVDTTSLVDNKTLTLTQFTNTTGNNVFAVTNLQGDVNASAISGNVSVTVAAGSGFDVSVLGGSGNDTIVGGAGNDSINGGAGSNSLTGGAGADVFTIANSGSSIDTITDLALNNTSDVVVNSGQVEATLQGNWVATNQTINSSGSYASFVINSSGKNVDLSLASGNGYKVVSSGAASVIGSSAGDYVQVGTDAAYGNVTATGGDGDDIYYARAGSITITDLGNGSDNFTINVFGAVDATVANNWVSGGGGWATYNEAAVSAAVIRVGSNYTVDLSADNYANGFTFFSTGTGAITGSNTAGSGDVFENTSGSATFTGLGGLDTFRSVTDTMTITDLAAGGAQEVVTNSATASVAATLAGNWVATSQTQNLGSYANFVITTSGLNANLSSAMVDVVGSSGQGYTITNTGAAASLTGSAAADSITGGSGNDTIAGGAGSDSISGGAGSNSLTGGAGVDIFTIGNSGSSDTITDLAVGDAADVVVVNSGGRVEALLQGNWTASSATVNNGSSNSSFIIRPDSAESVNLSQVTSGNGFYVDSTGTGSITGSLSDDYLILNNVAATFVGGLGNDVFHAFNGAVMTITDLGGWDSLYIANNYTNPAPTIYASVVADWNGGSSLFNSLGSINLTAALPGVDINVSAATSLYGWSITGNSGGEVLVGDNASDTINGAAGNDTITGGAGADQFVLTSLGSEDTIIDFIASDSDVIVFDLSDLGLGWQYSAGAATILTVAQVNLLGQLAAASNVIIVDTATAIASFQNTGGQFANTSLAVATDTGKVIFDLDSNYSFGTVDFANVTASQAALSTASNYLFIA